MPGFSELVEKAWGIGRGFGDRIAFPAPGVKHYQNNFFKNSRSSFVNISVTGTSCACRCAHCGGRLLESMLPATTPEKMRLLVERLAQKGCRGILVSGGSDENGEVPLRPFADAIGYAKEKGLRVLVHTGLISRETAAVLREAGVDQVLLDVIGDETTIREVYHLDRRPEDYLEAMLVCREAGLKIAPHVVIGLHHGSIRGEMKALEMISKAAPQALVLVILTPLKGTEMAEVNPPSPEEAAGVIAAARVMNPSIPIALGCAKPVGSYKQQVERLAVDCGVNAIAYADEATVSYALARGLRTVFSEECCSLAVLGIDGICSNNSRNNQEKCRI